MVETDKKLSNVTVETKSVGSGDKSVCQRRLLPVNRECVNVSTSFWLVFMKGFALTEVHVKSELSDGWAGNSNSARQTHINLGQ